MSYLEELCGYIPKDEGEAKDKEVLQKYIKDFDNLLTRENEYGHITASGFIINKDATKVLMIYHNIYDSWGWTGGHADGDTDMLYVAMKEAMEETGIEKVTPLTGVVDSIDILPVFGHFKRGKYISAHQHLNFTYILIGDENLPISHKVDENSDVAWIKKEDIVKTVREKDMIPVYLKLLERGEKYIDATRKKS